MQQGPSSDAECINSRPGEAVELDAQVRSRGDGIFCEGEKGIVEGTFQIKKYEGKKEAGEKIARDV